MRIIYFGHFKEILYSRFVKDIDVFVFESGKVPSEVMAYIELHHKTYYVIDQHASLEEIILKIDSPDLVVVGSFGRILSKQAIEHFDRRIINIHPGQLPNYRGRHPLPQAVLNRDEYMGITIHVLTDVIDCGNIIQRIEVPINYHESYIKNQETLYTHIPELLDRAINNVLNKEVDFYHQTLLEGCYYKPLDRETISRIVSSNRLLDLFQ